MPSTRFAATLCLGLSLTLAGRVGGAGFLGLEHHEATAENRAGVNDDVPVTAVHTDAEPAVISVALRYRNGTLERTTLGAEGIEGDPDPVSFVPSSATDLRLDGPRSTVQTSRSTRANVWGRPSPRGDPATWCSSRGNDPTGP